MKLRITINDVSRTCNVLQHAYPRRGVAAKLLFTACAFGVLATAPAVADDVAAGIDLFTTTSSYQDLDPTPIPADFFGPGSDPFDGVINFEGDPLAPSGPLKTTDTIVKRLENASLPDCPSSDAIPIEIVALSLVSSAPITVTFNGGMDPEDYDVRVCLSDCHFLALPDAACPGLQDGDLVGTMTIRHKCPGGGDFDSTLPVSAKFIFTPVGGGPELILDTGYNGYPPIAFSSVGLTPWVHADPQALAVGAGIQVDGNCNGVLDASLPASSNFVPGVALDNGCTCETPPGGPRTTTPVTDLADWAEHRFVPTPDGDEPIPTVSQWGIAIMGLLLLVGAKVYFGRRRAAQA